jgi:uncharacterized membrane protein YkvA (DUF1232 family)
MKTEGIDGILIETHNWGKTVAFWQDLGYEIEFETDRRAASVEAPLPLWGLMHQDVRLILRALRREDRPQWLLPVVLLILFFALDPLNLALPTLGILDELIVLPLMLRAVVILAGPDHLARERLG